jgi:predicted amidohydrolase YtcJ
MHRKFFADDHRLYIGATQRQRLKSGGKAMETPPDLIVHNGKVTTLQSDRPEAEAFAVRGERIIAVGGDAEIMDLRAPSTRLIDAGGRRLIPGLNDSHLHAVRGALMFNLELRWDGVAFLREGLEMIATEAKRTPADQWVRVMGGWTPFQFSERRMPTVAELNQAAPHTPVLVLFAYSEVLINEAGVKRLGLTPASDTAGDGSYKFVDGGAIVTGNIAVYAVIAKLPALANFDDRVNSTENFLRELTRFGITSTVDAGESATAYPDDYKALQLLATNSRLPVRISNFLFAQTSGTERAFWEKWTKEATPGVNRAACRLGGYVLRGGGEVMVWKAHDYENFMAPRPDWDASVEDNLTQVVRQLASNNWPIRMHATYDETITRILNVFERVFKETSYRNRWAIDHAETIKAPNIARIKAMGGGIAVQDRLAFTGEMFAERYGAEAAAEVFPLRQILDAGIPVGAGTDATRPTSYDPWLSLYWMVTGKTIGGMQLASKENLVSREEALRLYTIGSAWFSGEEKLKGRIAPGQYADFAILSDDYFAVDDEGIRSIESVLTVTGGDIVHAAPPFGEFAPKPVSPATPDWSPVALFGGYQATSRVRRGDETGGARRNKLSAAQH